MAFTGNFLTLFMVVWLAPFFLWGQQITLNPKDIASHFSSGDAEKRLAAVKAYAQECSGRRRHVFRRAAEGWQGYQRLLQDKNDHVVFAALAMSKCFKTHKTLPLLAKLSQHKSPKVMHEALTLLAHMENVAAVSTFIQWLKDKAELCDSTKPAKLDLCHLALYGLGQSSQHAAPDASERILAGDMLKAFLKDAQPKTRKVAAMALALGGAATHKEELQTLLQNEKQNVFPQANLPEDLQAIAQMMGQMRQ